MADRYSMDDLRDIREYHQLFNQGRVDGINGKRAKVPKPPLLSLLLSVRQLQPYLSWRGKSYWRGYNQGCRELEQQKQVQPESAPVPINQLPEVRASLRLQRRLAYLRTIAHQSVEPVKTDNQQLQHAYQQVVKQGIAQGKRDRKLLALNDQSLEHGLERNR